MLIIIPDAILLALALTVMAMDAFSTRRLRGALGPVTAAGLAAALGATLLFAPSFDGGTVLALLRADALALGGRALLLGCALLTVLLSGENEGVGRRGEYYALLLFSTLGMCWMVSAADMVMLVLGLELATIPLYVLAGFLKRDSRSTEAGLKYFLFGAAASAAMLYGFSLLYGFTGQTDLLAAGRALAVGGPALPAVLTALLLVLVGLGFKIAAAPFHFWAPDVYEGAPTPVTAFLSTASKAAGFAVLARVLFAAFPPSYAPYWGGLVAVMAFAGMTIGNLLALTQKNLKRLLAYSSIAHAGYALIGLTAMSGQGVASTLYYLLVYAATNLAAFAVVILVARAEGTEEVAGLAGLSRRSPAAALALLVALLSLAGMPPFGGFAAKLFVFASAVQSGQIVLAVAGVLNSIVGLYYYLSVLKVAYLYRSEAEQTPFPFPWRARLAVGAACALIVMTGVAVAPWFEWSWQAALAVLQG